MTCVKECMSMRIVYQILRDYSADFEQQKLPMTEILKALFDEAKDFRKTALEDWRILGLSVTPKVHLLEDHCIDTMIKYGYLEDFDEEFVERAHQTGV